MRVTSKLWVSAHLRRVQAGAAFATVVYKGEASAGAIFIVVYNMQGQASLLGPAPQSFFDEAGNQDRKFEWLVSNVPEDEVRARIERERSFDPDIWVVEVEDRNMEPYVKEIVDSSI